MLRGITSRRRFRPSLMILDSETAADTMDKIAIIVRTSSISFLGADLEMDLSAL